MRITDDVKKEIAKDIFLKTEYESQHFIQLKNNKNVNISIQTLEKLCKSFDCKIPNLIEYVPDEKI